MVKPLEEATDMQDAGCRIKRKVILKVCEVLSILTALLLLAAVALAQGSYDLSWHVIAEGGGQMQSAGYTLMGTIGQPAAGMLQSSSHSLCSGFWCGTVAEYRIYLPLTLKAYASQTPIFADDFNDGTLTGWTPGDGTWTNPGSYMRGEYALGGAWNMRSDSGSNIVYEGKVNLLSGNAVGLVFRSSTDGSSSYDVILDAVDNVFKISKRPPYQILASYSMTVQRNHEYQIKVVATGNTIEAYLDGTQRLTVTDTMYSTGQLGVMVFQATATYDDLEAWATP
jgi:hypothetical protein